MAVLLLLVGGCSGAIGEDAASSAQGLIGRGVLRPVPAVAAEPRRGGALSAQAVEWVAREAGALGLGSEDTFELLAPVRSFDGRSHVRLAQRHAGLPVFGAEVLVHADRTQLLGGGGQVLELSGLELSPRLPSDAASRQAHDDYATGAARGAQLQFDDEGTELVILPLPAQTARLAWHVRFFVEAQGGLPPGRWSVFIDAHDGTLLERANWLHSSAPQGSGPGGNARVPRTWESRLDAQVDGSGYALTSNRLLTVDMKGSRSGDGEVVRAPTLRFDDAAANDAHGFSEQTLALYREWFGADSIDDKGFRVVSRVHYGERYNNAFWNGKTMTYGDGDGTSMYPLSGALDIVAHELSHGFSEFHSKLIYRGESGALNESFSDIVGTAAKFYADPARAGFGLAGDAMVTEGETLRDLCTPSSDGSSIDSVEDYSDWMDVHYSSGVGNRAFCLAARRLSSGKSDGSATTAGVRRAAQAWVAANANDWTASSTFVAGCQGVLAAARALGFSDGELASLSDSWRDVGVDCLSVGEARDGGAGAGAASPDRVDGGRPGDGGSVDAGAR